MCSLNESFFEALSKKLEQLPSVYEGVNREESYMTAEQIKLWWGTRCSAEEIQQALVNRWQLDLLNNIRPAKYPDQHSLLLLWGHKTRLRPNSEVRLHNEDEPLELEVLHLPEDAPQLFVSFSSKDLVLAVKMRKCLAELGFGTWLYVTNIKKDRLISEIVQSGIKNCVGVVALLTRVSIGSAWVYTEVNVSINSGKPVFGIFDAMDAELIQLLQAWHPDRTFNSKSLEIAPFVKWYSDNIGEHHIDGYTTSLCDLLNTLNKYSGLVLYPTRPKNWNGEDIFLDFRELEEKLKIFN